MTMINEFEGESYGDKAIERRTTVIDTPKPGSIGPRPGNSTDEIKGAEKKD